MLKKAIFRLLSVKNSSAFRPQAIPRTTQPVPGQPRPNPPRPSAHHSQTEENRKTIHIRGSFRAINTLGMKLRLDQEPDSVTRASDFLSPEEFCEHFVNIIESCCPDSGPSVFQLRHIQEKDKREIESKLRSIGHVIFSPENFEHYFPAFAQLVQNNLNEHNEILFSPLIDLSKNDMDFAHRRQLLNFLVVQMTSGTLSTRARTFTCLLASMKKLISGYLEVVLKKGSEVTTDDYNILPALMFFTFYFFLPVEMTTSIFNFIFDSSYLHLFSSRNRISIYYVYLANSSVSRDVVTTTQNAKQMMKWLASAQPGPQTIPPLTYGDEKTVIPAKVFFQYLLADFELLIASDLPLNHLVPLTYLIKVRHRDQEYLVKALNKRLARETTLLETPPHMLTWILATIYLSKGLDPQKTTRLAIANHFLNSPGEIHKINLSNIGAILKGFREQEPEFAVEFAKIRAQLKGWSLACIYVPTSNPEFNFFQKFVSEIFDAVDAQPNLLIIHFRLYLKFLFLVAISMKGLSFKAFTVRKVEERLWKISEYPDLVLLDLLDILFIQKRHVNHIGLHSAPWKKLISRIMVLLKDDANKNYVTKMESAIGHLSSLMHTDPKGNPEIFEMQKFLEETKKNLEALKTE